MYQIKTFNAIAPEGMSRFGKDKYAINESETPDAIILRSQNLHDYDMPESMLAIARAGAGTNNVPVDACTEQGIVVFNTPGGNANAVKELVLASLLMSVRPILQGANWVQQLSGPNVEESVEANKKQLAGNELVGKKLGVIGLGSVGAMVANDAYRLGMEVMGFAPHVSVDTAWSISRRVTRAIDSDEIFKTCDFITVHVPLNDTTHHMVGANELSMMKATAKLFNFSRGEIVDTDALVAAVNENRIGGFTTDFVDERLLNNDKILVLPHLGASTEEAEINCAKMAARNLKRYLETGNIKNSVNFPLIDMAFNSPYRITVINRNVPNVLGQISTKIAAGEINIDNMINRGRGDFAFTQIDINETDYDKIIEVSNTLHELDNVIRVRVIKQPDSNY